MRKSRTVRQTVVKEAGQQKQVLLEQVDGPREGSKPHEHLHQLFQHYYKEEKDNDEVEEEEDE